eukprot:TRINITY_DN16225_c0_g2_i1.p1 TRINITY_DN16225_c0_g2~~TRINITY_DN16225_c0_g2_i1.p1  ORF type:complete len:593 (+),score=80.72 TRINITY_DN16225_c0_g2_i1:184-1962(+)
MLQKCSAPLLSGLEAAAADFDINLKALQENLRCLHAALETCRNNIQDEPLAGAKQLASCAELESEGRLAELVGPDRNEAVENTYPAVGEQQTSKDTEHLNVWNVGSRNDRVQNGQQDYLTFPLEEAMAQAEDPDVARLIVGEVVQEMGEADSNLDASITQEENIRTERTISRIIRMELDVDDDDEEEEEEAGISTGLVHIAKSLIPAIAILLNTVAIGLSLDVAKGSVVWDVVEIVFVVYYAGEIIAIMAASGFLHYFRPIKFWNYFDILCVIVGVIELSLGMYATMSESVSGVLGSSSGYSSLFVVFRLLRLSRVIRLARYKVFSDLVLMVSGYLEGTRILMWAMFLLFLITYVFGIICTSLLNSHTEFASLSASMLTVFRCFTDGCGSVAENLRQEWAAYQWGYNLAFLPIYVLVMVLVTIGFLNLVTAMFIDSITSSQLSRRHRKLQRTRQKFEHEVKENLCILSGWTELESDAYRHLHEGAKLRRWDAHIQETSTPITRSQFCGWLKEEQFLELLRNSDIEVEMSDELFDALDADGSNRLTLQEILLGLMKLRGPVAKTDIVEIIQRIKLLMKRMDDLQTRLFEGAAP